MYTVIPEKKTNVAGFMGSEHRYDFSYQKETEIALNPDELQDGISTELLKKKLAAEKQEPAPKAAPWAQASKAEDLSDMVAQHSQQQAKKKTKDDKEKKDFKF